MIAAVIWAVAASDTASKVASTAATDAGVAAAFPAVVPIAVSYTHLMPVATPFKPFPNAKEIRIRSRIWGIPMTRSIKPLIRLSRCV